MNKYKGLTSLEWQEMHGEALSGHALSVDFAERHTPGTVVCRQCKWWDHPRKERTGYCTHGAVTTGENTCQKACKGEWATRHDGRELKK